MKSRAQVSVIAVALICIFLVTAAALLYAFYVEMHSTSCLDLKVARIAEALVAIRGDLRRVLATILANASYTYAFHPYEHNMTKFRARALELLEAWVRAVSVHYGAILNLTYPRYDYAFQGMIYTIEENKIIKLYWYRRTAVSVGYIKAAVSIPALEVYNVTLDAFVSLAVSILSVYNDPTNDLTYLVLNVTADGRPVTSLEGIRIRVLYPDFDNYGYWCEATIVDTEYLGYGVWRIAVSPCVGEVWGVIPLRVYVIDHRNIVASALTYSAIVVHIDRNTPDYVVYFDPDDWSYHKILRTSTPDEIYTVELDWKFDLHFLLNAIPLETSRPPPIPPIPVKQLRLYISNDGIHWRPMPFQVELWAPRDWHGERIEMPKSPADPAYWFNTSCRLVFRVAYPTSLDKCVYVKITWESDCDADLPTWPTSLQYIYAPPDYKDIVSETFRIELIDVEHPVMRDYGFNYHGVAALGLREPATDEAYGPANIHAFGSYYGSLGAWRPYGCWRVFATYAGHYNWARLPIRIFAVLDTTLVGNVYTGDVRDDYYDTIAILYVINGSKYCACLVRIYWKYTKSDYGFWMFSCMGGGKPYWYMYLRRWYGSWWYGWYENASIVDDYGGWWWSHREYAYPYVFCTHWGSGIGRAVFLSLSAVDALYDVGSYPCFAVTKWAPGWIPQHSLEYEFSPIDELITVYAGTRYSYWFVLYRYVSEDTPYEWKKAYIYSVMFMEPYAPSIGVERVESG